MVTYVIWNVLLHCVPEIVVSSVNLLAITCLNVIDLIYQEEAQHCCLRPFHR